MKFSTLIAYWIAHNEAIIQWMLATIIGFSAYLVFRSVFRKDEEGSAHGANNDIHDLLKKVLDQTSILEKAMMSAPAAVVATMTGGEAAAPNAVVVGGSAAVGADPAEVAKLKKLIQERDEELNRLKNDPMAAKLREQISKVQELQSRLKEYEILEDDIADLSLYKEENGRLKAELEKLVGAGANAAAPVAADALVDQFAQVVDQTKGLESPPSAEGIANLPQTGDPMADFATAVKMEKAAETPPAAAPAPAPEAPMASVTPITSAPAPTPAPTPAAGGEANDLFAEFSSGSLDTDKVMEELVSIEKLPATDGKEALEAPLDADKVVAEAAGFSKN